MGQRQADLWSTELRTTQGNPVLKVGVEEASKVTPELKLNFVSYTFNNFVSSFTKCVYIYFYYCMSGDPFLILIPKCLE